MRLAAIVLALGVMVSAQQPAPTVTTWRLDNLSRAGSDAIEVIGAPSVVQTDIGPAIQFNGVSDGLLIARNPIGGLSRFTIEVLFAPDSEGPVEQRFLHIQEGTAENRRALIELRLNDGRWALDTYLRHDAAQIDAAGSVRTHTSAAWHVAAMTFDGTTQRGFVDGVEQGSGAVAFLPLGAGQTSIGVRQNRVFWFKGRIHTVASVQRRWRPRSSCKRHQGSSRSGRKECRAAKLMRVQSASSTAASSMFTIHRSRYYAPTGAPTGTAVIVCAGGSCARLAMDNGVAGAVHHLTLLGVGVFALKYRLSEYGHPAPLQDVLRAIRTVRSRADGIRCPSRSDRSLRRIWRAVTLPSSAAAWFDAPEGRTGAPIDTVSARPDFVALLYPVVTMQSTFAHADSRKNLLGANPSAGARSIACRSRSTRARTCRRSSSSTRRRIDRFRSKTARRWSDRYAPAAFQSNRISMKKARMALASRRASARRRHGRRA